jgi:hypothetical protein
MRLTPLSDLSSLKKSPRQASGLILSGKTAHESFGGAIQPKFDFTE